MVEMIKTEDLTRDQNLSGAAWNMLVLFQPPSVNEEPFRDLVMTLINAALALRTSNPNGMNIAQNLLYQIANLMPQIEKYAPGRVAALRQWSENVERNLDPWSRMNREINAAQTVEDVLAIASRYPRDMQSHAYQNAAWKVFGGGDISRARQIASDFISDPMQRRQTLDQFDEQLAQRNANDDALAEARFRMNKTKDPVLKAQILMQQASRLINQRDPQGGLNLLNEASSLVPAPAQNSQQAFVQIQLAGMFAALDLNQSFAILEPLIGKSNELVTAAVALDGFENRYLNQGEWMIPAGNNIGTLVSNLQEGLARLAKYDFDRAVALSGRLERPEIRVMCQLQIAHSVLAGNRAGKVRSSGHGFIAN